MPNRGAAPFGPAMTQLALRAAKICSRALRTPRIFPASSDALIPLPLIEIPEHLNTFSKDGSTRGARPRGQLGWESNFGVDNLQVEGQLEIL
jgi:hypothetical protein